MARLNSPKRVETNPSSVGQLVKHDRDRKGYTQQYLGLRLGRTKSWVSKVEQGKIALDADVIDQVAALLDWDQTQTNQVKKELLKERVGNESRREMLLESIRAKFDKLRRNSPDADIHEAVVLAFQVMKPLPIADFLQFVNDALIQATKLVEEGRVQKSQPDRRTQ